MVCDNNGQGLGFASRVTHLNKSGHAMLVENSNQGDGNPLMRGKAGPPRNNPDNASVATGGDGYCPFNLFRTGGDIGPDFGNIMGKLELVRPYLDHDTPISRPGCWAYPDMLEVGNFAGPLNHTESRTHFGAWCIVSSPLILGMDVTDPDLVRSVYDIISNEDAIRVNQQWAGHPGRRIAPGSTAGRCIAPACTHQVWGKILSRPAAVEEKEEEKRGSAVGGAVAAVAAAAAAAGVELQAILVINSGSDTPLDVSLKLADLGILPADMKAGVCARDVWARKDVGPVASDGSWDVKGLAQHDSAFYIFSRCK